MAKGDRISTIITTARTTPPAATVQRTRLTLIRGQKRAGIYRISVQRLTFLRCLKNPTNGFRVTLPRKHDMCSVMSNLRSHLLKLEKLLNTTYGDPISKPVADQYRTEFCTIRATIQQLLYCKCRTCYYDSTMIFLLATLSSSLSKSYRSIAMNIFMNLPSSEEDSNTSEDLVPLVSSLKLEMYHFRDICRVIREKTSKDPRAKIVGEAFHEMLCGEVKDVSRQLDSFLRTSNYWLSRTRDRIRVSCFSQENFLFTYCVSTGNHPQGRMVYR